MCERQMCRTCFCLGYDLVPVNGEWSCMEHLSIRDTADEIVRLSEQLAERTLQHQTQLDNAVRLTARLAEAERLLGSRAGKLLKKGKTFIVVAVDEPYFTFVFDLIRKQELKRGTWSEIDEQWYQDACDEWMHIEAAKGGRE